MNTSTLLIQSEKSDNHSMGTGFVVHQDSYGSYILTCAHVVKQVVTPKIAKIDLAVEIKKVDEVIDLALLYVKGLFLTPFELQVNKCNSRDVELLGFSSFGGEEYQGKPRAATILGEKITMIGREENFTYYKWQVIAKDQHEIEHGNSGAPLVCKESGKVIAVMTNNRSVKQGFAVSIEHLQELWKDMPSFLLEGIGSPFVGLSAFTLEESHLFFGRDKEISEIVDKLKEENILAVVGDSGSGKSSVIKAGVLPKCIEGILESDAEDKRAFYFIDTRPTKNPFEELSNSIDAISKNLKLTLNDIVSLKEAIKSGESSKILTVFQSIFQQEKVMLFLYIDQFEELFTLCTDKKLRQQFLKTITYLSNHQTSKLVIKVVLTMRRDYYNLVSDYTKFYQLIDKQKYTLHRMKDKALKECIVQPLRKTSISSAEVNTFADFVVQDMGDKSSELALLQIALTQTWNHKKNGISLLESYRDVRGVSGALEKLATDTIKVLEDEKKELLKVIFIRLVKVRDQGAITRRIADRSEFSKEEWILVQRLSSALDSEGNLATQYRVKLGRLLNIRGEDNSETVELVHEALITQWSVYQDWLNEVPRPLKKTHDSVIEKNKLYREKSSNKYLLIGVDLEEGEKLLSPSYREYLSQSEEEYIDESQVQRKLKFWYKVIVVAFLLAVILFLYFRDTPMSIKELQQRIETSERGRYSKDNNYINLVLVDSESSTKIDKKLILKKLIKISPNIAQGSERNYWLKRVDVMEDSRLDELSNVLLFEAYVSKGNAFFYKAMNKEAISAYSEAIKINPKEEYLYQYIGNAYSYMQEYEKSIVFYKKLLKYKPRNQEAYFSMGNSYNLMAQSFKMLGDNKYITQSNIAIETFQKLLKINPNHEYAYNGIGIAYVNLNKQVEAIHAFKKVVEINPKNFSTYYSIGLAYSYLGQYKESETYYKKALAINPKYEPIYNSLISQYRYLNETEKTIEYYKKYLKVNFKNNMLYMALFEYQLTNNREFDSVGEEQYIKQFKIYSYIYVQYEMLKILSNIYMGKDVNINEWQNKYRGIPLSWSFTQEDIWVDNMADGKVKTKLIEALNIFKNHR